MVIMKKLHDILLGKRKQGTKNTYIVFYHYEENGKIIYTFTYFLTRNSVKIALRNIESGYPQLTDK